MYSRVCALKLWVLVYVAALNLHLCLGENGTPDAEPGWVLEEKLWRDYDSRRYFYAHNETQITMARAEAEARNHDAGGATALTSILGSAAFPDFAPSEDSCLWNSVGAHDLSFVGRGIFEGLNNGEIRSSADEVQILAVDFCSKERNVQLGYDLFEFCSQRWVNPNPDILIRDPPSLSRRSFKVLVKIRTEELEVLADGVYFPATGKMHLVGCSGGRQRLPDYSNYVTTSTPPTAGDFALSTAEMMSVQYELGPILAESPGVEEDGTKYVPRWDDPDNHHKPPLNSSALFQDCAISATLQYPPLNSRWNSDRVLKYSVRSNRAEDDPLYFAPIERSAFFPYPSSYVNSQMPIQSQRRLETGGRILLLVLGLVCIALQIEHGRKHEESLPFVSLVMLAIQLAHHLSQTSIFKDLQISGYNVGNYMLPDGSSGNSGFPGSDLEYDYYGAMAWSEHVPYQAMAMAAIFMYVWIFHKVGDRRRIMKLRVIRKRPGAKDPPSDWRVMYGTLAFFCIVLFLGFWVIGADDQDGHFRRALTGMTAADDRHYRFVELQRSNSLAATSNVDVDNYSPGTFVSSRFYELSQAHWGFVNRLTGVVLSFFLVPQLLGNKEWEVRGRPLSVWFYAGIPFVQSLPHVFSIAKHFQLLPIFPGLYDPYINSVYGIFEDDPTPWWQIAVVLCSSLLVLAVHSQFSRSLRGSRDSRLSNTHVESFDLL